jgi:hypothetical protein
MKDIVGTGHLHHVQTHDLSNCVSWYEGHLGLRETWSRYPAVGAALDESYGAR